MGRPSRYSPEVRERAVRMVLEHAREHDSQCTAIRSIAAKIGCSSETLRHWAVDRDTGRRPGLTTEERQYCPNGTHQCHSMTPTGIGMMLTVRLRRRVAE